jgi:hypothetical protein
VTDGFFWDGYLHWAYDIEMYDPEFGDGGKEFPLYEPIFIRMIGLEPAKIEEISDYLFRIVEEGGPAHPQFDEFKELKFLNFNNYAYEIVDVLIGFQHAVVEQSQPEFFIYRPVARTQSDHDKDIGIFTVIDVGAPARVNRNPFIIKPTPPVDLDRNVIAAVIDNDIGYLNQTFCRGDGTSRISAIWLQAREQLIFKSVVPMVTIGQILNAAHINQMKQTFGRDERGTYAKLNDQLHMRAAYRQPPPIAAHGAMVADLAFGNREGSSVNDVPIMAVQLPPEAAHDTSGTTSESYIVQGVRWICFWARWHAPQARVVINISYGVLAGQKDGGKFLEAQIEREIALAQLYTPSQIVEVVFPFGNDRNAKQVADVTVERGPGAELTWVVPADNPAPTFAEIRAIGPGNPPRVAALPSDVTVTLLSPSGSPVALAGGLTDPVADPPVTISGGAAPVRLYNVPEHNITGRPLQMGYVLAAIGPTRARVANLPRAEAGDWRIHLHNTGQKAIRIILQIQRGDTAPGYRNGGRQSRFEGRLIPVIEDGMQGVTVEAPLTNAGTCSAFVNSAAFETAGAGRKVFDARIVRAPYSAQGADWTYATDPRHLPEVDNAFGRGIAVSGTYSGTRARLSGTSAGAALTTRERISAP